MVEAFKEKGNKKGEVAVVPKLVEDSVPVITFARMRDNLTHDRSEGVAPNAYRGQKNLDMTANVQDVLALNEAKGPRDLQDKLLSRLSEILPDPKIRQVPKRIV